MICLATPRLQGGGFSWLLPLQDGAPPIGWPDALAYLSLPIALIASQYISQKIISPAQSQDPSQQSSQWILKVLPLMIGASPARLMQLLHTQKQVRVFRQGGRTYVQAKGRRVPVKGGCTLFLQSGHVMTMTMSLAPDPAAAPTMLAQATFR